MAEQRNASFDRIKAIVQRKNLERTELEDGELAYRTSLAELVQTRAREAQVLLEQASRKGNPNPNPAEIKRLRADYHVTRVRSAEVVLENAVRRLEIARDRVRIYRMPGNELSLFQKMVDDARSALEAEKRALGSAGTAFVGSGFTAGRIANARDDR